MLFDVHSRIIEFCDFDNDNDASPKRKAFMKIRFRFKRFIFFSLQKTPNGSHEP